MKVYLAARFSRLPELLNCKTAIESLANSRGLDITVTSRWLLGGHEWVGVPDEEIPVEHNAIFAGQDLEDIDASDVVVCFTEPSQSPYSRGGRHVEMGYALAKGKAVVAVGHRENVFYCLPEVDFMETWREAQTWLLGFASRSDIESEAA